MNDLHKPWDEMTRAERHRDCLRHFPTMLDRWRGGYGLLWEYSVSLRRLVIRLQRSGVTGNLHIQCAPLILIHAPTEWSDTNIEIDVVDDSAESHFLISDVDNDVRIVVGGVSLAENVKPIYTPS